MSARYLRFFILFFLTGTLFLFVDCDGNTYKQGKILYEMYCQNCHMENGEGLKGLIPPLAKSDYLVKHRSELPCIIRKGLVGNIEVNGIQYGQQQMLGIDKFTEFELNNILNYVDNNWGNTGKLWKSDEIRDYLRQCPY